MEACSGRLMAAGFQAVSSASCGPEEENPAFYHSFFAYDFAGHQ